MRTQLRSWSLRGQAMALGWAATLRRQIGDRLSGAVADERGQTPTEYLMIVGLMAAVIVVVFVTFYWGQVQQAATDWVDKVRGAILGEGIQQ